MYRTNFLALVIALCWSGTSLAQAPTALGKWTPMFRTGQILVGDIVVTQGQIAFDNNLTLKLAFPGIDIPKYKWYTTIVHATAYPITTDATHIVLRHAYPICHGQQPKWLVLAVLPDTSEHRNDLSVTLSLTNPAHPTNPNTPNFAEKVCNQITYIPGTMTASHDED